MHSEYGLALPVIFLAATALGSGRAVSAQTSGDVMNKVDAFVKAEMQRQKVPGLAIASSGDAA